MPRYMLDTDTSSYIMKRSQPAVLHRLGEMTTREVCISVITLAELTYGVAVSPRATTDQAALDGYLTHIAVLPLTESAAAHYGAIRASLRSSGQMIGGNDLLIAAHARSLGLVLVTNNDREFSRVPGLQIENWTATKT